MVVLQCEAITDIDVTAADMLDRLDTELNTQGIHMAFVELRTRLHDLVYRYGLFETVDRDHFYSSIDDALLAIRSEEAGESTTPLNEIGWRREPAPADTGQRSGSGWSGGPSTGQKLRRANRRIPDAGTEAHEADRRSDHGDGGGDDEGDAERRRHVGLAGRFGEPGDGRDHGQRRGSRSGRSRC